MGILAAMSGLTIDSREYKPLIALVQFAIPNSTVSALHSGDYVFHDVSGKEVAVERKAIGDFLNSISGHMASGNQRLTDQLDRMVVDHDSLYLLLEGFWGMSPEGFITLGKKVTGWKPAAMQMALVSLQTKYPIKVLWSPSHEGTVATLKALYDRSKTKEV